MSKKARAYAELTAVEPGRSIPQTPNGRGFVRFLPEEQKVRTQMNMAIGTILYIKYRSSFKDFQHNLSCKEKIPGVQRDMSANPGFQQTGQPIGYCVHTYQGTFLYPH